MAKAKKVQTDQARKKQKSKDKSKNSKPKVKEVQTDQVRRRHKPEDKPKKTKNSKIKRVTTGKSGLEKAEHQLGDLTPSSHDQKSEVARNEQSYRAISDGPQDKT